MSLPITVRSYSGDKVINGSCKLSLTTSALCLLNTLFSEAINSESAEIESISATDSIEDVQFLYAFMRETSSLKLFHGVQTLRGGVDLSHFTSLTVLELRKIPTHLIVGLSSLSVQLKALICSRSIYLLKEIFASSFDDDTKVIHVWSELKELILSYNYLESLDCSLKCLPAVEILDLSHNHIKSVEEIQVLNNLTFVNLSYNELDHLPVFNISSCRSLTRLSVRNNSLESLDGLDCLFNLEEFDASHNLLSEYHVLSPLDKLKSLRILNLEGNPLYFHNQHSDLVIRLVSRSALSRGLQLNGKRVCIHQCSIPTLKDEEGDLSTHHQTSINTVVGDAQTVNFVPVVGELLSRSISQISDKDSFDENSISSYSETEISEKKFRRRKSKGKKKKLLKEVLINELQDQKEDGNRVPPVLAQPIVPSHMKSREEIEARRRERGELWLIPDNSFTSSSFAPPQVPTNTPIFSELSSVEVHPLPTPEEMANVLDIHVENTKDNDDIEVLSSDCSKEAELVLHPNVSNERVDIYDRSDIAIDLEEIADEAGLSEEECEDSIFFVERQDEFNKLPISIGIGCDYIKEKDVMSPTKLVERLDLNCLQSVELSKNEMDECCNCKLCLQFDCVKTSKQIRCYIFDDSESAKKVLETLQPFADAKMLRDSTIGALTCVKCNSQFSKQGADRIILRSKKPLYKKDVYSSSIDSNKDYVEEVNACPNCGSHILVELESIPIPGETFIRSPNNSAIKKSSPDTSSIGSGSSGGFLSALFPSLRISPILKKKIMNVATEDSLTLEFQADENGNPNSTNEADMSRKSSDITIISNPSQSSIDILPDPEMSLDAIAESNSQSTPSPLTESSIYFNANRVSHPEMSQSNEVTIEESSLLMESEGHTDASTFDWMPVHKPIAPSFFTDFDHRLKLHLEIDVLTKEDELQFCLEGSIVPLSSGEEYTGLLAVSTEKIYLFKLNPLYKNQLEQGEPIEKVIQLTNSWTLSRLKQIKMLYKNQGFIITCGSQTFTFMVRDQDISSSFFELFKDFMINEKESQVQFMHSSDDTLNLLPESVFLSTLQSSEVILYFCGFWSNSLESESNPSLSVCITVTSTDIFISQMCFKKHTSRFNLLDFCPYTYLLLDCKEISNIASVVVEKDFNCVEISFLDESPNTESDFWTIRVRSSNALIPFLTTIKDLWEAVFWVPLDITHRTEQHT